MSWVLCSSGAAIAKAGADANTAIVASSATLAEWSAEVEGTINAVTRKDWIAAYPTLSTNYKKVLDELASDMIALRIVNYDVGSVGRSIAAIILNVLSDNITRNLEVLKDENQRSKWQ